MIVGVIAMAMVQPPVMDEIHVGTMLDAHVLLAVMAVRVIVGGHARSQFLGFGVGGADFQGMLVDMAVMRVVEVAVVQVIDMARMFERLMAAALCMGVAFVRGMEHLVGAGGSSDKGKRESGQI